MMFLLYNIIHSKNNITINYLEQFQNNCNILFLTMKHLEIFYITCSENNVKTTFFF